MRIDQPYYTLLLLLIPAAGWLFFRFMKWRKIALAKWANESLRQRLLPGISVVRTQLKFVALMIAVAFIILALTNFQFLSSGGNQKRQGVDVAIVLDVSNSMLSQDIDSNRLDEAKKVASAIID